MNPECSTEAARAAIFFLFSFQIRPGSLLGAIVPAVVLVVLGRPASSSRAGSPAAALRSDDEAASVQAPP